MSNSITKNVVVLEEGCMLSISFVVDCAPPVQQRTRMHSNNKKGKAKWVPTFYDPSKLKKKYGKKIWKKLC